MARNPAPWPDAWRQEYLDTIRKAISSDPNAPEFPRRLEILRKGFVLYWPDLKNTPERSHFEVRRAEIRWYVENLMAVELPGEEETSLLRHQYEDLANHAAEGLIAQFSFLDPNKVHEAKAAYLADCQLKIDAPLLPIHLMPFSQGQMEQIKERWHNLRYARVDLWRQLGGGRTSSSRNQGVTSGQAHPDYLLTQRSLDLWQAHIWVLAATEPEYSRMAAANEMKSQRQRLEAMSEARAGELRVDNATLQTEYLSFLLGALLETAREEFSGTPGTQDGGTPGR